MSRGRKSNPPGVGAAFAVPLEDGRYSVCRVLLDSSGDPLKDGNVLIACSTWVGESVPDASDPALRPILRLTHHKWKNVLATMWVSGSPPKDFVPLGSIEPSEDERELNVRSNSAWNWAVIQPLAQWRWDHEREAVLAEDVARHREEAERAEGSRQERKQYLAEVTLESLSKKKFFADWEYPSEEAIAASRRVLSETVDALMELGADAPETDRSAVLRRCIESFNTIDDEMDQFIETEEREDICFEFEAIARACGLGAEQAEELMELRDW